MTCREFSGIRLKIRFAALGRWRWSRRPPLRHRTGGRIRRASSISTCWPCPGRRPIARRRRSAARSADRSRSSGGRPYSFVVHGLWPQYDRGSPTLLPAAGAAAGRPHRVVDARSDARGRPGLQRVGQARHLLRPAAARVFRDLRKARAAIKIPEKFSSFRAQDGYAGRGRGRLRQGQSRTQRVGDCGHLRHAASQRSAHLHEQGSPVPRLRGGRSPRLPARARWRCRRCAAAERHKRSVAVVIARSASDEAIHVSGVA